MNNSGSLVERQDNIVVCKTASKNSRTEQIIFNNIKYLYNYIWRIQYWKKTKKLNTYQSQKSLGPFSLQQPRPIIIILRADRLLRPASIRSWL